MDTVNTAVLTIAITSVAKLQDDEPFPTKIIVGGMVYVIALATLNGYNSNFAKSMSSLVLLVATFTYLPGIMKDMNLYSGPVPKWG